MNNITKKYLAHHGDLNHKLCLQKAYKAIPMPPDGRRVFAVKLTNSLAMILSTNTWRIVGIFITDCDFKSRVFCWFNLLSQQFRDGDTSGERKTNVTSARQVVLDNYANSRCHVRLLFYLSSAPLLLLQHEIFLK